MGQWQLALISFSWVLLATVLVAPVSDRMWLSRTCDAVQTSRPQQRLTATDEVSLLQTGLGLQTRDFPRVAASTPIDSISPLNRESDRADWLGHVEDPSWMPSESSLSAPPALESGLSNIDLVMDSPAFEGTSRASNGELPERIDGLISAEMPPADTLKLNEEENSIQQAESKGFDLQLPESDDLSQRFAEAADASSRGTSASIYSNSASSYTPNTAETWADPLTLPFRSGEVQRNARDASPVPADPQNAAPSGQKISEQLVQKLAAELSSEKAKAAESQTALAGLQAQDDELKEVEAEIRDQAAAKVRLTLQAAAERVHDTLVKAREAIAAEEARHAQVVDNNRLAALQLQRMSISSLLSNASQANSTSSDSSGTLTPFSLVNTTSPPANCGDTDHFVECGTWNRIFTLNYRFSMAGGVCIWIAILLVSMCCASGFGLFFAFEGWVICIIQVLCCFALAAFIGTLYMEWKV